MAAQGRDIKLSTQRVEGYRNFATKLWNACRFAEMNDCALPPDFDPSPRQSETLNRWIAHETSRVDARGDGGDRSLSLQRCGGRDLSLRLEHLLRLVSRARQAGAAGRGGRAKAETRAMVAWARDEILKLLHPFMPFITEELWAVTAKREGLLVLAHGRARRAR